MTLPNSKLHSIIAFKGLFTRKCLLQIIIIMIKLLRPHQVWDVPSETAIELKSGRGGGVAHLAYSPDGTKLLTATTSPLFR